MSPWNRIPLNWKFHTRLGVLTRDSERLDEPDDEEDIEDWKRENASDDQLEEALIEMINKK